MGDTPAPKRAPKHRTERPPLSAREVRFCIQYVEHDNITRAHREAGFEAASDNAHTVAGRKLLRKAQIREYLRELQAEAMDEAKVTVGRIVQHLAAIAFADRGDLFDDRGRLLPPRRWPKDIARAVEGVDSEDLFEQVASYDPDTKKTVRRKELVGYARKVRTAKRTEALKILATWKRMVGADVPPLDVLLGALPPEVAAVVREALARAVPPDDGSGPPGPTGGVGGDANLDAV